MMHLVLLRNAWHEDVVRETSGLRESEFNRLQPMTGMVFGQHVGELQAGKRIDVARSVAGIDTRCPDALLEPLGVVRTERESQPSDQEYVHNPDATGPPPACRDPNRGSRPEGRLLGDLRRSYALGT